MEEIFELPIYKKRGMDFITHKKDIISNFPDNFKSKKLSEAIHNNDVEYASTSGTTGERMQIIRRKKWWDSEYKRTYQAHPLLLSSLENFRNKAVFTTAICSNTTCHLGEATLEERTKGKTLYLNSSFNPWTWTEKDINRIIEELEMHRPYYLDIDPVYFYIFLKLKEKFKIKKELFQPTVITISYEYCPTNLYEYLNEFFSGEVVNLYGTTETGYLFIGNELKMSFIDYSSEVSFKQILDSNYYELIVTSYKNDLMPLINYLVGDIVYISEKQYKKFGKSKEITRISGRKRDCYISNSQVITIYDIDCLIRKNSSIHLFKVQIKNDYIEFQYIEDEANDIEITTIVREIKKLFNKQVKAISVTKIMPENSGKFQLFTIKGE
ncbi:hypothetical protein [Enterococcus sp. UD-01]|jgi:phenylacetate-CoA ligase|uniref:hypothetical protein n=1 Tax=Enterococcus sp. UD-01 TaxID=3373911 RepID=UPI0038390028